jgi:hypothetical protein
MTVRCGCGVEVEIAEATILSEAARIYARRRKRCGPKPKPVACPHCSTPCEGQPGLIAHLPSCAAAIAYTAGLDITDVDDFFIESGIRPSA